jgi:N,N-dimethylformamidase beta subunit-like protein/Big-like domain-containing protein
MKNRLVYASTLLAFVGALWLAPQPASAQLGSLIVNITSPNSGDTVSGTIPVNASVSIIGTLTVSRVEFFSDGNFIGSDSGAPYSVSWDTRTVGNGPHSLVAVAVDVLGVRWNSNSVTVTVSNDTTQPTVTINQAATQADPTSASPINFTVVFSEAVSGFTGADVTISGTAGGTKTVAVSGGPSTYTVAVSGMTGSGTVIATIAAGVAQDAAGNTNVASTSTDNSVQFNLPDTAPPLTRSEENHPAVSSGPAGAWVQQGQDVGSFSGGAAVSSNVSGAVASFTFTGKAVSWIGLKCNVCGIASVSIDGGAPVTVDTAGPAAPNPKLKSETLFAASLADGTHTLTITVTGTSTSGGSHIVVDAFDVAGPSASPIVVENLFPGSENWQMRRPGFQPADDVGKQIKGYASATSVNKGESITFHVTVTPAQQYTMDVYRMGWYQGLGGRLLQRIGPLPGTLQPACPVDAATGLIECAWTPGHTLTVPQSWTSGVYVVQLTNALGYQTYITFVVRDDARRADILYQQSVTTYQAYNNYPDDGVTGKSLYDFNSYGANASENPGSPRAVKVSWNRPYSGEGAGHFFNWEYYFVRWLERAGYDATYSTNHDTHLNSARLLNSKAFLSVGHDEYWSKAMYDGVEAARNAGVSLGFFGADAVFWQVRFEASPATGVANRVMVGYKNRSLDPVQGPTTTVLWRDPFLNRPEQQLVGVQFSGQVNTNVPYVVTNSSSWVYQGTGLVDGNSIPGLVGYEIDSSMSSAPFPTSVAGTYQVLSQSPYNDVSGPQLVGNSSIYQAPSGAWVFGAGTISWSWGLDLPGVVDPRIQRATANLLNRFLGIPAQPVPLQP